MAMTDGRESVKPSVSARASKRSVPTQSADRSTTLKTNNGAGREAVRQSPPRNLNAR